MRGVKKKNFKKNHNCIFDWNCAFSVTTSMITT